MVYNMNWQRLGALASVVSFVFQIGYIYPSQSMIHSQLYEIRNYIYRDDPFYTLEHLKRRLYVIFQLLLSGRRFLYWRLFFPFKCVLEEVTIV